MKGTFECPKSVQAVAERIKPSYRSLDVVEVTFCNEGCILDDFAKVEYKAILIASGRKEDEMPFTEEEFIQYCRTFVASRIAWVNGQTSSIVIYPTDHMLAPSLVDSVCKNIGVVYETSLGYTLVPKIAEGIQTLSKEKCAEVSFFLSSLNNYIGGYGYVRDKSGSWDFMSMQMIESAIMSFNDQAHPAYSVLAAIVGPRWLVESVSPRVRYGSIDLYKGLLWELTSC
jgi:hypothetical protein